MVSVGQCHGLESVIQMVHPLRSLTAPSPPTGFQRAGRLASLSHILADAPQNSELPVQSVGRAEAPA
jgi:hypothetical protein